jgi:RHS repeat-associated protein
LVYQRNSSDELTLESTAFGAGRIEVSESSNGSIYTPNYFLTDHLGSTRIVYDATLDGTVRERNDFLPYGSRIDIASGAISDNRYRFSGKEEQTLFGLPYNDHGARMYDPLTGRWISLDPLLQYHSGYIYGGNNPINRIDADGRWDVTVHVYQNRSEYGYGVAVVSDRHGNEVYRFNVRAEGVGGNNSMRTGANTPLGTYDIPDGQAWIIGGNRASYGPNARLNMNGESGEIAESGRSAIRIHGGRQEVYNPDTGTWSAISNPQLEKTNGCLRAYDEDMANFKQITDNLQSNDSREVPGKVTVIDDLQRIETPSETNSVEIKVEYRVPQQELKYWQNYINNFFNSKN